MNSANSYNEILDPLLIPKFAHKLTIPQIIKKNNCYGIAIRKTHQQILPHFDINKKPFGKTSVFCYGDIHDESTFEYPGPTIEATYNEPTTLKWINELVDENNNYLQHILPIDPTLHWADPMNNLMTMDSSVHSTEYKGPIPCVTHVHGAHTLDVSDGHPEAWFLPNAKDIPKDCLMVGPKYDEFKKKHDKIYNVEKSKNKKMGFALATYPNDQRDTMLWYHDHTLGITRSNVYAGLTGLYFIRGNSNDKVYDSRTGCSSAVLPKMNPTTNTRKTYEIPLIIQDRTFQTNGELFFPRNRAYFEGLGADQLDIPFKPNMVSPTIMSDVNPIWNPEFFGNTIVVNGRVWPYLKVEPVRYRFRILNACNARVLKLRLSEKKSSFWVIGSDGGYIKEPVLLDELIISPSERYDVIIDFHKLSYTDKINMINVGPDQPFNGSDDPPADDKTTGIIMQFIIQIQKHI